MYEFPDGSIYQVTVSGLANGGARTEIDVTLPPDARAPSPHVHRQQEESWSVLDGSLDALVGRRWRTLESGASLVIPPGTAHTFRNRSGENVRFIAVHTPSLGSERYLERLYWLSAMNRIRGTRSIASLLYTALLLDTHRADQVPAGAGRRLGVRVLARAARLLRLRIDR